jgi:glyoxylase-like metal-dependent hydrolase (beta-lactamase superfamily II)
MDRTNILTGPGEPLRERKGRLLSFLIEGGMSRREASELLEIVLRRYKGAFSTLTEQTIVQGGEVFRFDDFDLEIIHTPGHSPGSIVLLNRRDGILFCGDSLIEEITFNPALESEGEEPVSGYRSLASFRASLDLIESLPVKKALPGHGSPFSDVAGTVERLRRHHVERSTKILNLLRTWRNSHPHEKAPTRRRIAFDMFPSASGPELFHRLAAVHVHLSDLVAKALVARVNRNGESNEYELIR